MEKSKPLSITVAFKLNSHNGAFIGEYRSENYILTDIDYSETGMMSRLHATLAMRHPKIMLG